MQNLKSIENSFELLSIKTKLQIFLFPFLIFCGIYLYFVSLETSLKRTNLNMIEIKKIKMKVEIIDILKDIEKFAFDNEIYLNKLSKGDNFLQFTATCSLKKSLVLLVFLEKYNAFSKINSFAIDKSSLNVTIDFSKFYKKSFIDFDSKLIKLKDKKEKSFLLSAIVGNRAFINNKWFKINDSIENFIIKKIENKTVVLENRFKQINLNLIQKN